ncbi:hypothetical protein DID78_05660 [Candidatus Marinamargulisbacteria bacterium SCGC AG-343-D04]|nr:hypothetical protein DID78_05660 [Candidatus Marinamargulisbacteria bacterium SCGC AG-343-D04]
MVVFLHSNARAAIRRNAATGVAKKALNKRSWVSPSSNRHQQDVTEMTQDAYSGNPTAELKLSDYFSSCNRKKSSFKYCRRSAEKGNVDAQYQLGMKYYKGDGVGSNSKEAFRWLLLAFNRDHKGALAQLIELDVTPSDIKDVLLKNEVRESFYEKACSSAISLGAKQKAFLLALDVLHGHSTALPELIGLAKDGSQDALEKLDQIANDVEGKMVPLGNGDQKSVTDILNEISFRCPISFTRYFKKGGQDWKELKLRNRHTLFFREGADKTMQDAYVQVGEVGECTPLKNLVKWLENKHTCPITRDDLSLCSPFLKSVHKTPEHLSNERYSPGLMYYHGVEGEQSYEKALKWYTFAVNQGNADDQFYLGTMYYQGKGTGPDMSEEERMQEAVKWFQKAADQGHAAAKNNLEFIEINALQKTIHR